MNLFDAIVAESVLARESRNEPCIEEVYDSEGNLIDARMYGYTRIRDFSFLYCQSLALTSLPAGVTEIGFDAFSGCTGLTTLTFEGTPLRIDQFAFSDCDNLTVINVPWAIGEVEGAPWGAENATINYGYRV